MTKISYLVEVKGPLMDDRVFKTFEISDEEAEVMIETDYQQRLSIAVNGEVTTRRTVQEIIDESNRKFRNQEIYNMKHYVIKDTKINDDEGEECTVNYLEVMEDEESETPEEYAERMESQRQVDEFLSTLTETQRRRTVLAMQGYTTREIAEIEGCSHTSVEETLQAVGKKYKKFF